MASHPQTPKEVTAQLGIASSTLRAWSTRFASVLSKDANPPEGPTGGVGRRLYNPSDVATLARARDLLASGLTFDRTLATLQTEPEPQPLAVQEPRALATSDLGRALLTIADQTDRLDILERRISDLENRPQDRPRWLRWLRS